MSGHPAPRGAGAMGAALRGQGKELAGGGGVRSVGCAAPAEPAACPRPLRWPLPSPASSLVPQAWEGVRRRQNGSSAQRKGLVTPEG